VNERGVVGLGLAGGSVDNAIRDPETQIKHAEFRRAAIPGIARCDRDSSSHSENETDVAVAVLESPVLINLEAGLPVVVLIKTVPPFDAVPAEHIPAFESAEGPNY